MRNTTSTLLIVLMGLVVMNLPAQPVWAFPVGNGFDTDDIYVLRNSGCESNVQILDETMLDGPGPYTDGMDKGILYSYASGWGTDEKAICTRYKWDNNGQDSSRIKSLCFSNSPVPGQYTPAGPRLFGVYEVRSAQGPREVPAGCQEAQYDPPAYDYTNYTASFQIVELDSTGKRIRVMSVGYAASTFHDLPGEWEKCNNHSPDMLVAPWCDDDTWGEWIRHGVNNGARSGTIRYNPVKNTLMVAVAMAEFDPAMNLHPVTGEPAYARGRIYEFALPDWPEVYYESEADLPYYCSNKAQMVGQPIPQSDPDVVKLVQIYEMPNPHSVSSNNGQIRDTNVRPAIDFDSNGNVYFTSKFFNATTPPNRSSVWHGDGLWHGDVVKCSTKGKIGGRNIYVVPLTDDPNTPEDESTNLVIQRENQAALGHGSYAGASGLAVRGNQLVICPRNGNLEQHCNGPGTEPPDYWIHIFDLTDTEDGYPNELKLLKVLDNDRCNWPRGGAEYLQRDDVSGRIYLSNLLGACGGCTGPTAQNYMCLQNDYPTDTLVGDLGYHLAESCAYPASGGGCTGHEGDSSCILKTVWDSASPPPPPGPEPTGACCTGTPCDNCQDGVPLSQCDPRNWLGAGTTCADYGGSCPSQCNDPSMDGDCDGDVDQDDFAIFQTCYSGNGNPHPSDPDNCRCFDRGSDAPDGDGDIDSFDFDAFQGCSNGPNVPADCCFGVGCCGNGELDPGEVCDDAGESATCDDDCTVVECGDGTVNSTAGEECDDAGESNMCDADCTLIVCGDGTVNSSACEECEDGNTDPGDGCDENCIIEVCGNGVLQVGEECDDGGESATCDDDCTLVVCGDGTLNVTAGEGCDDGNTDPGDGCDENCVIEECGNDVLQVGEECDDGNTDPGDGCDENCVIEECGNGVP
ncbi:MAG: hypothetical protein JSV03_00120, partial [Planctomycetota bacterium]